jgi:hypothetical protein
MALAPLGVVNGRLLAKLIIVRTGCHNGVTAMRKRRLVAQP